MEVPRRAADLTVGEKSSISHTVTETDLAMFAAATGDVNPIHFDDVYAHKTFFKGRIAHGMLAAGFISAVIANRLPGISTIYVSQSLRFLGPVRIGDRITAEVEVLEADPVKNRVKLRTTCTNQAGVVVLDGEGVVMPPKDTAGITDDPGLADRLARAEQRIAEGAKAFAAPLQEEADGRANLLAEQLDFWLGACSAYRKQIEGLVSAWVGQTVAAQLESQKLVRDWMVSLSRNSAQVCTAWGKNALRTGRLWGFGADGGGEGP